MMRHFLVMGLAALVGTCAAPAYAHKPSDSYLTLNVVGDKIVGQWDIALRDLDFAIGLDQDGDGELTWDEIRAKHGDIAAYALSRLTLGSADSASNGACPLQVTQHLIDEHSDGAYAVLRFTAACHATIIALDIGYQLFFDIDSQHKGLLKLEHEGQTSTAIFSPDRARQTLRVADVSKSQQFFDYIKHGVWHIWVGFDHILFLLALLLPAVLIYRDRQWNSGRSFKAALIDVLKIVTAFTLAHSLTLTLATLKVVALPSRWVESAIAASVMFAALNNVWPLFQGRRPLAAFAFGLIHGFGFASVLLDLGLPQSSLLLSLVGFNLGVEVGQIALVTLFLPLAYFARSTFFYRRIVLAAGSAVIVLIALLWLIERAFDLKLIS